MDVSNRNIAGRKNAGYMLGIGLVIYIFGEWLDISWLTSIGGLLFATGIIVCVAIGGLLVMRLCLARPLNTISILALAATIYLMYSNERFRHWVISSFKFDTQQKIESTSNSGKKSPILVSGHTPPVSYQHATNIAGVKKRPVNRLNVAELVYNRPHNIGALDENTARVRIREALRNIHTATTIGVNKADYSGLVCEARASIEHYTSQHDSKGNMSFRLAYEKAMLYYEAANGYWEEYLKHGGINERGDSSMPESFIIYIRQYGLDVDVSRFKQVPKISLSDQTIYIMPLNDCLSLVWAVADIFVKKMIAAIPVDDVPLAESHPSTLVEDLNNSRPFGINTQEQHAKRKTDTSQAPRGPNINLTIQEQRENEEEFIVSVRREYQRRLNQPHRNNVSPNMNSPPKWQVREGKTRPDGVRTFNENQFIARHNGRYGGSFATAREASLKARDLNIQQKYNQEAALEQAVNSRQDGVFMLNSRAGNWTYKYDKTINIFVVYQE
jgi:hypothetical protein